MLKPSPEQIAELLEKVRSAKNPQDAVKAGLRIMRALDALNAEEQGKLFIAYPNLRLFVLGALTCAADMQIQKGSLEHLETKGSA
ncbi:MAG: hypothetical protein UY96_C0013G0007 [Parcubacteria group bacterium GW2011_GWB1_56_8]|nr:MAG: hypothetical protein UY96_C0013G0007 [Parcubacteria group bacterium GW2011_GWB1_56_8]